MVVVACNTSTCYSIDWLRQHFTIPFVGTVPAVKPACRRSTAKSVAVMSTPATARSTFLKNLIRDFGNGCSVSRIGCPGLEEAIEEGSLDSDETIALLERYLARVRASGADQLVLGCTHYPFLRSHIRTRHSIDMVDSGAAIARRTQFLLASHGLTRPGGTGGISFWTTGTPGSFSRAASTLLGYPVRARKAKI
jgi:glutamate racemase